jgi:hypothetical protein
MAHTLPNSLPIEQILMFTVPLESSPGPLRSELASLRLQTTKVEKRYARLGREREELWERIQRIVQQLNS